MFFFQYKFTFEKFTNVYHEKILKSHFHDFEKNYKKVSNSS